MGQTTYFRGRTVTQFGKTVAICGMILQVEVHGFDCLADLVIRVTNGHKTFLTTILGKWLCTVNAVPNRPLFLQQQDNTVLDIF